MKSVHTGEYKAVIEVMASARKRAGVTQQQLADRLKKPQSFVAKYERGERRIDVAEFIAIMRALDADPKRVFAEILDSEAIKPRRLRRPSRERA